MAETLVCSANTGIRLGCGNRCGRCGHLILDRRYQKVAADRRFFPDRRRLASFAPQLVRPAVNGPVTGGPGAGGYAGRKPAEALPLFLAVALVVFNLLDAFLTSRALSMGVAEANPVMAGLFRLNMPVAMLIKTVAVAGGVICLWRFWNLRVARVGMSLLVCLYGAVIVYHLTFQLLPLR